MKGCGMWIACNVLDAAGLALYKCRLTLMFDILSADWTYLIVGVELEL